MTARTRKRVSVSLVLLGLTAALPLHCRADEDSLALKLSNSLANGHPLLEIRPRYARITETVKPEATDAWTVRAMLGWQTAPLFDTRITAQYIYTGIIGPENLNADPSKFSSSPYPLLPDPAHAGVNQFYADYTGLPSTRLRVGRQILRIDDQRFISDVDFRQTPQVFDGATLINTALPATEIQLGEYRRMRTVLGALNNLRLHVLHLAWNPAPEHKLAAYGYWQDQAATGAQTGFGNNANRITGVQAEGGVGIDENWRWLYFISWAKQNRIERGDARIDADYNRAGMGLQWNRGATLWGARIDREVKGSSNGTYGFQTPLTDYYGFNGWALQYTSTPAAGLRDTWATLRGQVGEFGMFIEDHRFRSDYGSRELGNELDANVTYLIANQYLLKLQHARFRAGRDAAVKDDVTKTWLSLTYTY